MEAKTKKILLEYYKKMYEEMKSSVLKEKIGRLIRELENESKPDQKTMETKGGDTCSTKEGRQNSERNKC